MKENLLQKVSELLKIGEKLQARKDDIEYNIKINETALEATEDPEIQKTQSKRIKDLKKESNEISEKIKGFKEDVAKLKSECANQLQGNNEPTLEK